MLTATAKAPVLPIAAPTLLNPYLESWMQHCELEMATTVDAAKAPAKHRLARAGRTISARRELVKKYSFAIPTEEVIRTICRYSPLIEIGAGTGYWAWLVSQLGGDILAYDINPPKREACPGANRFHGNEGCWTNVAPGTEAAIRMHPDRTLLLGWPPFQEPLALQALRLYRGEYFLYIGALPLANGWKGPMATDDFLEDLKRNWLLTQSLELPNWDLCWDALHIFKHR